MNLRVDHFFQHLAASGIVEEDLILLKGREVFASCRHIESSGHVSTLLQYDAYVKLAY